MSRSGRHLPDLLILVAAIGLMLSLRSVFWSQPLDNNEGLYGYTAQRILAGELPYRDVDDNKPPLLYGIYAATLALFGPASAEGIRLAASLAWVVILLLGTAIAGRLYGPGPAWITAAGLALLSAGISFFGYTAQAEVFMTAFLMGAIWAMVKALFPPGPVMPGASTPHPNRLLFWSGLLWGAALLVKPVVVYHLPVFLLIIIWMMARRADPQLADKVITSKTLGPQPAGNAGQVDAPRGGASLLWGLGAWLLGGLVMATALAAFLFLTRLWPYFYANCVEIVALIMTDPLPRETVVGRLHDWFLYQGLGAELGLVMLLALFLAGRALAGRRPPDVLLGTLLLAAGWEATQGWHLFPYYIMPLVPILVLASAAAAGELWRRGNMARVVLLVLILVQAVFLINYDLPFYRDPTLHLGSNPRNRVFDIGRRVGLYIRENSQPSDRVFNWGVDWEIYFYAQRAFPGPYLNLNQLQYALDAAGRELPPRRAAFVNSYLVAFQTGLGANLAWKLPRYMVVSVPGPPLGSKDPRFTLSREVAGLIARHYRLALDLGPVKLLERIGPERVDKGGVRR